MSTLLERITVAAGDDPALVDQLDLVLRKRSAVAEQSAAVAKLPQAVTPQIAAAVQAHENVVRAMEAEFGLLTSNEVAVRMGSRSASRSYASDLRKADRVLSIRRLNSYRFPGFQFDARGRIKPLISPLIALAHESGWSVEDATLWMLSGTRYLHGARPVDRIDDVDAVLEAARGAWGIEW